MVAGTFLILTMGFGSAYSFGTFFTPLQDEFGASRAAVSVAFSAAILCLFSVGPISGTIADRLGPRLLVAGGTALVGIGMMAASMGQALWHIQLAFAVGIGGGVGLAYVPAVGAVQKWFDRRRGLASGLAVAGIGAGTLAVPPFAALMISQIEWRPAFLVVGAIVVAAGGAAGLLVTNPTGKRHDDKPVGGETDGGATLSGHPVAPVPAAARRVSARILRPIHSHGPSRALRGGPGNIVASGGNAAEPAGIGSAVGRFVIGAAADRIGRWRGLGLSFGGVGVSCILWLTGDGMVSLGVFAVIVGTFWGGSVALAPSVMADYFGTRAVSGIIGVLYTGVGLGAFVGPIMAGVVFDLWESYSVAILSSIIGPILAAASVLSAEAPERWRSRIATSAGSRAEMKEQQAGGGN